MDIKMVNSFIQVARLKSFSKAAQILYVTQTGVSHHIGVLEEELGVKLLYRDKKTVQLTAAGEFFLKESYCLLSQYENAVEKTRGIAQGDDGMLKIGFFSMFDREMLSHVLTDYHQKSPKIKISLSQCSYRDMSWNLLNKVLDIGFSFDLVSDELEEMKVYQAYPKLCVNRNHPLAQKEIVHLEDLKGERIILFDKNKGQKESCEAYNQKNRLRLKLDHSLLVESMEDAMMLVNNNSGVSFLPELYSFVNPEKIAFVDQSVVKVPFSIHAYWMKNNENPVLGVFVNEIKKKYDVYHSDTEEMN
ncbi:MAG: transcriptional regulator [Bacillota bacterium]|jgi:DNA-binding transcriptional LysR family regulator|nr:transcriptional regulator [Bacillota bacterium]